MMSDNRQIGKGIKSISRHTFLPILDAGLKSKSYRFTRQAALIWLEAYPGDLEINLRLAKVLFSEGKVAQAISILEKLCELDPEFLGGQEALAKAYSSTISEQYVNTLACVKVLGGFVPAGMILPGWSDVLLNAYKTFTDGKYDEAYQAIHQMLGLNPENLLADVLHLRLACANQEEAVIMQLATMYHERWQECLHFTLVLADAQSENGDETGAVSLLHQCVAQDATGQVARRLWGDHHRYSPLWPESLEINFELPIPSDVSACLGWNRLGAGSMVTSGQIEEKDIPVEKPVDHAKEKESEATPDFSQEISKPDNLVKDQEAIAKQTLPGKTEDNIDKKDEEIVYPLLRRPSTRKDKHIRSVEQVFERLAKTLNQPAIAHSDGRFPMYVIFSSYSALVNKYGPQTTAIIDTDLKELADAIRKRPGWGAMVYYPDSPEIMGALGLTPISSNDPWRLKLSLVDLDKALAKKGAMIGALLIVGGPAIVPFHLLPNPTDDTDGEVSSDNPYSTLDSNYFVPEWSVGRLPGEDGADAGLLLDQVRHVIQFHSNAIQGESWWTRWLFPFDIFGSLFRRIRRTDAKRKSLPNSNFGLTAAIWRRSSIAVYRPLGDANALLTAPPAQTGNYNIDKMMRSSLAYYNLHGVADGADWYGQRDSGDHASGSDYPVALRTNDLVKNSHAPQIIFSEACFGAHIDKRTINDALALKFISIGTTAVIASTCTAYGSVATPLIGADLLGYLFWKRLREGYNTGEAMVYAKVELAREMNRRQGYLDGEDQKTLISFVLFGDPLASFYEYQAKGKSVLRLVSHPDVRTICDQPENPACAQQVSGRTIVEVKKALEAYLPGLDNAEIHFSQQFATCEERAAGVGAKRKKAEDTGNIVMTFSKQYRVAKRIHRHYARVTVNPEGKMVKLVISR